MIGAGVGLALIAQLILAVALALHFLGPVTVFAHGG